MLTEILIGLEIELNYVFIKINPDEKDFNIFTEINKIHRHIKKSTKKSLINDLSKRLLELEFQQHNAIKSKCFSFFNWDSLHARLNSHYEAWSYKKRSTKKITGYRKSV